MACILSFLPNSNVCAFFNKGLRFSCMLATMIVKGEGVLIGPRCVKQPDSGDEKLEKSSQLEFADNKLLIDLWRV